MSLLMFRVPKYSVSQIVTLQSEASWLLVDSNETPGGLASTDVTAEGFVYLPIPLANSYVG